MGSDSWVEYDRLWGFHETLLTQNWAENLFSYNLFPTLVPIDCCLVALETAAAVLLAGPF